MLYFKKGATEQQVIEHFENHEINGVGKEMASGTTVWYEYEKDYSLDYFTFVSQENSTTFKFSGSTSSNTLQYSLDKGTTWNTLVHNTNSPTVESGNSIMFKASGLTITGMNIGIGKFVSTGQFQTQGNIMSLYFSDSFSAQTSLEGKVSAFTSLFSGCTGITSAENLILPATTLADNCYRLMFRGCSNLTKAPELPATTLASGCYYYMFTGCTSLYTAPELPATTLANNCYGSMFRNCTSLTTAPELPATTLATSCYNNMFDGCTSLTSAPELPATTLATSCYNNMFNNCSNLNYVKCLASSGMTSSNCLTGWLYGVASTGTFVKSTNATTGSSAGASQWKINSVDGIPSGWTVVDAS